MTDNENNQNTPSSNSSNGVEIRLSNFEKDLSHLRSTVDSLSNRLSDGLNKLFMLGLTTAFALVTLGIGSFLGLAIWADGKFDRLDDKIDTKYIWLDEKIESKYQVLDDKIEDIVEDINEIKILQKDITVIQENIQKTSNRILGVLSTEYNIPIETNSTIEDQNVDSESEIDISEEKNKPIELDKNSYVSIGTEILTENPEKIEVMEFFWLGCPHCFELEPHLESWEKTKPEYVYFVREAPPLNPAWENHSRSFYAAQILGIENRFVHAMYDAIHVDGKPMRDVNRIGDLATSFGISKEQFISTMTSSVVDSRIEYAGKLARLAGIVSVPSILVNGKYITDVSLSGSRDQLVDTIDGLIEKERVEGGF